MTHELPPLRQRLASGAAWAAVVKIGNVGLGLLLSGLLARLLEPSVFGAYFLALTIVSLMSLTARLGLDKIIVRLVAERLAVGAHAGIPRALRPALTAIGMSTAVTGIILWHFLAPWLAADIFKSPPLGAVTGLMALWASVMTFRIVSAEIFRGLHRIPSAVAVEGLFANLIATGLLFQVWLFRGSASLGTIIIIAVVAETLTSLGAGRVLSRHLRTLRTGASTALTMNELLQSSWPLLIANMAHYIITHADLWIVGGFLDQESVALYGAAARLVLLVNFSLMIANQVVPPVISELTVTQQHDRLERTLRVAASVAAIPALVVLLVFIFMGRELLTLIFGPVYREAGMVLALLSVGQLVNVLVGSCGITLIMTGHQRSLMLISTASGAIGIGGAVIAVRPLGIEGVALATLGAMLFQQATMLIVAHKQCGVWTHVSPTLLLWAVRSLRRRV